MTASPPAAVRRAWIAWLAICFIWGTTYLAIKVALATVPPFLIGGLRYVTGGSLLAALLVLRGRELPPRAHWGKLAVLGFFMLMLGNGGVVWGEQYVPSGLTAVLVGTSPFWMVVVDGLLPGGQRLGWRQWGGLVIGFLGIVILVWPDIAAGGASARGLAFGIVSLQVACAGWSIGSNYTRRHVMPRDVLGSAAMQMLFGGGFMLLAGTLLGEWGSLSFSGRSVAAIAYLALAGSVVAFAAYSYALQHLDVSVVSLYTYVNPVIAVTLGTLILDEPFGWHMVVAAVVIVTGVLAVSARGSRRR
jgi:drug/metabolite transporter (DMT)-like permease